MAHALVPANWFAALPPGAHWRSRTHWLLACIALGAAYGLAARLGFAYSSLAHNVTLIWAPTGISLFALLRWGPGLWPGIVLGDLIANAGNATPWAAVAGITLGNVAQALLGLAALRRLGFRDSLERVQDALSLLLLGSGAAAVSASFGIAALWGAGVLAAADTGVAWLHWVMGDATGVAVLTPWLLAWWPLAHGAARVFEAASRRRAFEIAALLAALALVSAAVFSGLLSAEGASRRPGNDAAALALFPIVIWAALRFGLRGATLATVLISIAAVAGTVQGHGPFAAIGQTDSLTRWWLFASVVSVTGLLLASSQRERDRARAEAVRDRDFGNAVFDAEGALLLVLDADDRIRRVNRALELATGFTAADLVGQPFETALVPEDQRAKVKGHSDLLHMRVSDRVRHDSTLRRRHGPPITVSWTMTAIRGPDRRLKHAIVSGVDVSARVEAAAALRRARRELETRVAERTRDLADANAALQVEMAERARLGSAVMEVSEREQQRFGRELHDGLGQHLTATAIQAELLAMDLGAAGQHAAQAQAEQVEAMLSQAVADTRLLARGLFPVDIDGEGLQAALAELAAATGRQLRRDCTLDCPAPVDIDDPTVAVHLYRIAQEAVNNAVKHAPGAAIDVLLRQDDDGGIRLRVRNAVLPGRAVSGSRSQVGPDADAIAPAVPDGESGDGGENGAGVTTGIGQHIMRQRARLIGARLASGHDDGGWCVDLLLPAPPRTAHPA